MKTHSLTRSALAFLLAAASCLSWAQAPAPAAPAAPASGAASAPSAAASNPLLVLPQWAQDKVIASRNDPKVFDQAYKHGAKLATFCANCHGPSGHSVKPEVPNLAGQNTVYVLTQLNKFHEGKRRGAFFMEGLVKAMSNDERFAVAVYYTSQEPKATPPADPALAAKGQQIYQKGCKKCHGDTGYGSEKNARIAGQQPLYMTNAIRRYRDNDVRSDERMYKYTKALTDDDIKALVAYVGSMQ
jgi:cbb3-type cytochrome c oxidase subunit III